MLSQSLFKGRVMDCWSVRVRIREQSFPRCYFECESKTNYGNYVIDEMECALNEEACDQARRVLLGKENAEILKLEDDLKTLENQLAWADVSWSEIDSDIPMSVRVKSLDLSIRSLKNKYLEDDLNIGVSSLLCGELVERWQTILKRLPEKYLPQKAIQADDLIIKELVFVTPQSETGLIAGMRNVSCSTPETVRKKDEVKEIIKSNIGESVLADKHETSIMVKKSDISWFMPTVMKKEVERSNDFILKESVSADPQHETDQIVEKKSICSFLETARKEEKVKQRECAKIGDVISDSPVHVTDDLMEPKEQLLSLRSPSKESSFLVLSPSLKHTGNGNYLPGMTKPESDLTSDAIEHKIGSEVKNKLSEVGSNEEGLKEIKTHSFAEKSISLTLALSNTEKETKFSENVKFVGHTSESVLNDLHRASEGTKVDPKTEKTKTGTQGIRVPGGSLSDRELNKLDGLLDFYNHKREQLSKMNSKERDNKKAKYEPLSNLSLKSLKPKPKPKPKPSKIFNQKPKVEYDLYEPQKKSVGSVSKRQLESSSQNLPVIEKEKKLKSLEFDHIFALPTNSTESSSAESVCINSLAINEAPTKEAPRVLPCGRLPNVPPDRADLEKLKLVKLRDIAKQIGLKGHSKSTKSKLIEEIGSKLVSGINEYNSSLRGSFGIHRFNVHEKRKRIK